MRARDRNVGQVAAAALALLGMLALAGCSQDPAEASDLPTPDVVWVGGEPTGEIWESAWANAYLSANSEWAAARAFGDFSDPKLVAAIGYDAASSEARTVVDDRFSAQSDQREIYELNGAYAFWGAIIAIDVAADGRSALVNGCEAAVQGGDKLVPVPQHFLMTRNDDGTYSVDRSVPLGTDGVQEAKACSDAKIWVAEWATPIDIDDVGRDSVKMPLPRDYYIDLGVIAQ